MTRLTEANAKDLPNWRLISSLINDSVHRPNSNLNCWGELSRTAWAFQRISSALIFGGRPGIGLARSAFCPPSANWAGQLKTVRVLTRTRPQSISRNRMNPRHGSIKIHCDLRTFNRAENAKLRTINKKKLTAGSLKHDQANNVPPRSSVDFNQYKNLSRLKLKSPRPNISHVTANDAKEMTIIPAPKVISHSP